MSVSELKQILSAQRGDEDLPPCCCQGCRRRRPPCRPAPRSPPTSMSIWQRRRPSRSMIEPMQTPSLPSQRWQPTQAASCVVLRAPVVTKIPNRPPTELVQFILNFVFFLCRFVSWLLTGAAGLAPSETARESHTLGADRQA